MSPQDRDRSRPLSPGFKVGHWTDEAARTGCTVVLPPLGNVASCDIRGSSPSSRELALLHTDRKLTEIHGVLLTGGSAFGLAAAQGVVEWLAARDIGYQTSITAVPIVPAAVVFDLAAGDPDSRPGPAQGSSACDDARTDNVARGAVGAGTGGTVGKWAGLEFSVRGGLGLGKAEESGHEVCALAVVNSVGDVIAQDGSAIAGTTAPNPVYAPPSRSESDMPANTVLVVVTTVAALDKREVRWLAMRGSDGITVSIRPAHTRYDGDVVFAIAAPPDEVDSVEGHSDEGASPPDERGLTSLDVLGYLTTKAVAAAVRNAVSSL